MLIDLLARRVGTPTLSCRKKVYMEIVDKVRPMIEGVINSNGYKIDDMEYVKEGSLYFLRVVIDKEGFITVDDCVVVSKLINPILDAEDPISDNYILDVCSKEKGSE